jgi:hypothetical protein
MTYSRAGASDRGLIHLIRWAPRPGQLWPIVLPLRIKEGLPTILELMVKEVSRYGSRGAPASQTACGSIAI